MMENVEIMNYIISIAPAITAIISVIGALLVAIKKVKNIDEGHKKEIKTLNNHMNGILQENAELKQEIKKIIKTINHIHE